MEHGRGFSMELSLPFKGQYLLSEAQERSIISHRELTALVYIQRLRYLVGQSFINAGEVVGDRFRKSLSQVIRSENFREL
jgi:hypothetical protein